VNPIELSIISWYTCGVTGTRRPRGAKGEIDPALMARKLSTARRLVEIVKVLSKNRRIILMGEPASSLTRGIDAGAKADLPHDEYTIGRTAG